MNNHFGVLINKIITKLSFFTNAGLISVAMSIHRFNNSTLSYEKNWLDLKEKYEVFIYQHKRVRCLIQKVCEIDAIEGGNCVGAVMLEDKVVFIPNSSNFINSYSVANNEVISWGNLHDGHFKWTGGGVIGKKIFAFPRSSDYLLEIDIKHKIQKYHKIYNHNNKEHHYGGVVYGDCLYQPPRNNDYIMCVDLNTMKTERITIGLPGIKIKFRYCASVIHPNGYIYFLPERNERVIKFDPKTRQFRFIGEKIKQCMVFGGAIAPNGNIYGFSLYNGLLCLDTNNDTVKIKREDIHFGCYGTKIGINGKIYGIPGDSEFFWEYDIENDIITTPGFRLNNAKAKCAGGSTTNRGDIYTSPAFGNTVYKIGFNNNETIPEDVYKHFFCDNY